MQAKNPAIRYNEEQRFFLLISVSLIISLALNFLLFWTIKEITLPTPWLIPVKPVEEGVRLEFVDSPERTLPPPDQPRDTNLISDKASLAQDVIPDKTTKTASPRSVGPARIKSIRKIPRGKPGDIEKPSWKSRRAEGENIPDPGFLLSRKRPREETDRQKRLAVPGEESPFAMEGKDKFLSLEAENPEGKTSILKQAAYNTLSPAVGKYFARLKPRIVNQCVLNIISNTFYVRSENTSILFKIMPDGRLGKMILNEHKGPPVEMMYGLNAIEQAQPFEPLTKEIQEYIKDDGLWVEFNFIYH